ncbi:MAG: hypothetical protein EOM76_13000 [Sphingobacteriia bacterium]|nr:hypothetical protein [Sphingobacteriia bacterium]
MKKAAFILGTILVSTVLSANAVAVPGDSKTASHNVGISVSKFALIDIETSGNDININLTPNSVDEAGMGLNFDNVTDNSLWLNYSSIVGSNHTRSISASITEGLPAGVSLKVAASAPASSGKGTLGASAATTATTLTTGGITIINGIGSCYTGNGANNGSNLTYSVVVNDDNYASILEDDYSVTVTYTISE